MTPEDPSWAAHVHKLTELHRDIANGVVPPEEAKVRLAQIKAEQEEFMKSPERRRLNNQTHDIVQRRIVEQEEENMRQVRRPRIIYRPQHQFSFSCQCRRCVSFSTITMQDKDLLKEMGIVWSKIKQDNDLDGSLFSLDYQTEETK